jgi:mycothiol synthase
MTPVEADRPMITVTTLERLQDGDLADALRLVAEAWAYDEEAGFTRITDDLVRLSGGNGVVVRHLLVRGRLDDTGREGDDDLLLAYLNLVVDGDEGMARLLVHPDYRSRGVSTLIAETVGLNLGSEGWLGTGAQAVRGWAYGHHPAAERLSRRFSLARLSQTLLQVRQLTGPYALPIVEAPLPEGIVVERLTGTPDAGTVDACRTVLSAGGVSVEEQHGLLASLESGSVGGLLARDATGDPIGLALLDDGIGVFELRRAASLRTLVVAPAHRASGVGLALLTANLRDGVERGAEVALLRIDATEERAVRMVRRLGFERNQDDVLYGFGALG